MRRIWFIKLSAAAAPFFVAPAILAPAIAYQPLDTSQSQPLCIRTNSGTKPFNANTFMPPIRSVWHGVDTSYMQPLGIRTNTGTKPFNATTAPYLVERPRDVVDTSNGMPECLRPSGPAPFNSNTLNQTIRSVWQGLDTSQSLPQTLRPSGPGPFTGNTFSAPIRSSWQGLDTSQNLWRGALTVTPFAAQYYPFVERPRDVFDTSQSMPQGLRPSGPGPFIVQPYTIVQRPADVTDTSQSMSLALRGIPSPFTANTFILLPVSQWQPLDTSRSIPKVLTPDSVTPFFVAPFPQVSATWNITDTSQSAPQTLIGQQPPFVAQHYPLVQRSYDVIIDTSQSMSPGLRQALVQPQFVSPWMMVQRAGDVIDTSQGMSFALRTFVPPVPPFVPMPFFAATVSLWQPGDTTFSGNINLNPPPPPIPPPVVIPPGGGWRGFLYDAVKRRQREKAPAPLPTSVSIAQVRELIAEARTRLDYRVIAQPIVTDIAALASAMRARQLREELAEFEELLQFIAELREDLE